MSNSPVYDTNAPSPAALAQAQAEALSAVLAHKKGRGVLDGGALYAARRGATGAPTPLRSGAVRENNIATTAYAINNSGTSGITPARVHPEIKCLLPIVDSSTTLASITAQALIIGVPLEESEMLRLASNIPDFQPPFQGGPQGGGGFRSGGRGSRLQGEGRGQLNTLAQTFNVLGVQFHNTPTQARMGAARGREQVQGGGHGRNNTLGRGWRGGAMEAQDSDTWLVAAQGHSWDALSPPKVGSAAERGGPGALVAARRGGLTPGWDLSRGGLGDFRDWPLGRREAAGAVEDEDPLGPLGSSSSQHRRTLEEAGASGHGPASGHTEAGREHGQGEGGEQDECVICFEGGKTHALLPCGHMVLNPNPQP